MELVRWGLPKLPIADLAMIRRTSTALTSHAEYEACKRFRQLKWALVLEEVAGRGMCGNWWVMEVACRMPSPVWQHFFLIDLMPTSVDVEPGLVRYLMSDDQLYRQVLYRLTDATIETLGQFILEEFERIMYMQSDWMVVEFMRVCGMACLWHQLTYPGKTWVLIDALLAGMHILDFVVESVFPLEDVLTHHASVPSCVIREIAMACRGYDGAVNGLTSGMMDRVDRCCPEFFHPSV